MNEKFPWLCSTIRSDYNLNDDNSTAEGGLVDSMEIESGDLYGAKMRYYVVSSDVGRDVVFGEDQMRTVERAFFFTGYLAEMPSGLRTYQLQGIWGEDIFRIQISKSFPLYSTYRGNSEAGVFSQMSPRIGDLIQITTTGLFYEIIDVLYWKNASGLVRHSWEVCVRVWRNGNLDIGSGIDSDDPIRKVSWDILATEEL